MKNLVILFLIIFCCSCEKDIKTIESYTVDGDITLSSQEEVNKFIRENRNTENLIINGSLFIGVSVGSSEISNIINIEGLSNLSVVTQDFYISKNILLKSLKGLESLIEVGGTFDILYNGISETSNFSKLKKVNSLIIFQNSSLTNLPNFNCLVDLKELSISSKSNLLHINGLEQITSLDFLNIDANEKLIDLSGLDSLNLVSGNTYIEVNNSLKTLNGLGNLERIGGSFGIYGYIWGGLAFNQSLSSLSLPKLKYIGGDLDLRNSKVVRNFNFGSLDTIGGSLRISEVEQLDFLTGFKNLKFIGGDFEFNHNHIKNIPLFNMLNRIAGKLSVQFNEKLEGFEGLENLNKIDSYIFILSNPDLKSLKGLDNITEVKSISIENNSQLIDFCPIKECVLTIIRSNPNANPFYIFFAYENGIECSYLNFESICLKLNTEL